MEQRLPIGQRYLISKTLKADLISTLIKDDHLRGAVEAYEAIIDDLEEKLERSNSKVAALKQDKKTLEEQLSAAKIEG